MDIGICIVPAAPVRKKASHKVEMVNQLLFGEAMQIVLRKRNWYKIQSLQDNYEGWIRNNLLMHAEESALDNSFVAVDVINTISIGEANMNVPMGSTLHRLKNGEGKIGAMKYTFKGFSFNRTDIKPGADITRQLSFQWLNAPYLWGGRTPLGVDCSGFVQVVFKMIGIDLLRDANQQIGQGMKIKKLEEAVCGDLAFFKNKKDKITHVGILLSPTQIIHASGKVRIDEINEKGIIHSETKKQTHSLAGLRRFW
jgi:hypothetical protein